VKAGEARRLVHELRETGTGSIIETVTAFLNDCQDHDDLDMDALKIAGYALLVDPIVAGVQDFVRRPKPGVVWPGEQYLPRPELARRIGSLLDFQIWQALIDDRERMDLASDMFSKLADRSSSEVAKMRRTLAHVITAAAMSSARSTMTDLEANAYTVQRERPELDWLEEIVIVRASHHLPLAHPFLHLEDLGIARLILTARSYSYANGEAYPEELLTLNETTGKVTLAKPLQKWHVGPTLTIDQLTARHETVRVGCPFSFAETDIRSGYYEAVVDLVVDHGIWPRREGGATA
jgi:hypothetical protein